MPNGKNPRGSGKVNITAKKGVDTKKSIFNNFIVLLLLIFLQYGGEGGCLFAFSLFFYNKFEAMNIL